MFKTVAIIEDKTEIQRSYLIGSRPRNEWNGCEGRFWSHSQWQWVDLASPWVWPEAGVTVSCLLSLIWRKENWNWRYPSLGSEIINVGLTPGRLHACQVRTVSTGRLEIQVSLSSFPVFPWSHKPWFSCKILCGSKILCCSSEISSASYFQNSPCRDAKDHLGDSLSTLHCLLHFLWMMIHGEWSQQRKSARCWGGGGSQTPQCSTPVCAQLLFFGVHIHLLSVMLFLGRLPFLSGNLSLLVQTIADDSHCKLWEESSACPAVILGSGSFQGGLVEISTLSWVDKWLLLAQFFGPYKTPEEA